MIYLIDSDLIIEFLKGRSPAVHLLSRLAPDGLAMSLVTFGEIYEGVFGSINRVEHEAAFIAIQEWIPVLPLDEETMRIFAHIRRRLRGAGQLIGDFNTLIAATAIYHDLTLVTRNLRHYERVPHLRIWNLEGRVITKALSVLGRGRSSAVLGMFHPSPPLWLVSDMH